MLAILLIPVLLPDIRAADPAPLADNATTEEWPHFLGPHFDATTREQPLLEKWPEAGLKVVWEAPRGEGYSCPVIADGRLFHFHQVDGGETLDCLDPATGEKEWSFSYPIEYRDRYGFSAGPRSSPVVADGRVFIAGVTAQLNCIDAKTGKRIWHRDLEKDYAVPQYFFGYGPTPFVHGDKLIINVGGKADGDKGVCVAAFDVKTGKTLWEVTDTWGASYASPMVAELRGKTCALVMAGGESKPAHGGLLTIEVETGKVLDRFPWRARKYESVLASSPLAIDDRRVFISECYELGGVLLEFDEELKSRPVWKQREFGMHFMMPIVKDGHLFGFAGRNPPDTEFKCVDLEKGEIAWTKDYRWQENGMIEGLFRGSLLQAGDRYFALGEDGIFIELRISPKGTEEVQRTRLFTAREAWTLPALHRGLLYVVQNTPAADAGRRLICYDLRGE
ncbi:PQQ-binding-like beta-propeller repeat protein [Haloferula helveola]|uniref:PQQ-binding-like beta-propeller repeat protein n=1 Tax=Haloferula helveola TaxID=490095 RepID=UPI0030D178CA